MRVTEISVKGLFGVFDHVIPLNLEDRITIIHGPNGVGKTVLLKMIDAFFRKQYAKLQDVTFKEFSIFFDDESALQVTKQARGLLQVLIECNTKEQEEHSIESGEVAATRKDRFEFLPPPLWKAEPAWLAERQNAISTQLIDTQRLFFFSPTELNGTASSSDAPTSPPKEHLLTVEKYSQELSEKILSTLAESAEVSQSLERTFPNRLVQKSFSPLSETELRSQLKQLEQEQTRLASIGVLTNGHGLEFQSTLPIDEQNINALSIYVQDAHQKLRVFDNLADRLNLLKRIVEQKFLYKKLSISKEDGLVFTTTDGQIIPLSGLSSGEQHELVLLHDLLFNTKAGSLILIDEPEISLHLAWQKQFLSDLQQIAELSSFDVILATHSPQIIHDRWDLTVGLKGPNQ